MSTTLRDLSTFGPSELHRKLVLLGFEKSEALVRAWFAGGSQPTAQDLPMLGEALGCVTKAQRRLLALACGHSVAQWIDSGEDVGEVPDAP